MKIINSNNNKIKMECEYCGRSYTSNGRKYETHKRKCKVGEIVEATRRAINVIDSGGEIIGNPLPTYKIPAKLHYILEEYIKLKLETHQSLK